MTVITITIIYNILLLNLVFGLSWLISLKDILALLGHGGISLIISHMISSVLSLILIYLSMALSKVTIRNRKIGVLWFIIFLMINGIVGYLVGRVNLALPYYFDISRFRFVSPYEIGMISESMGSFTGSSISITGILLGLSNVAYINIFGNLFQILIGTVTF